MRALGTTVIVLAVAARATPAWENAAFTGAAFNDKRRATRPETRKASLRELR